MNKRVYGSGQRNSFPSTWSKDPPAKIITTYYNNYANVQTCLDKSRNPN